MPATRQSALFSATMPPEIRRLPTQYLYDPVTVKVQAPTLTVDTVEQFGLEAPARGKTGALVRVLEAERPEQALVFVRTKARCEQLYRELRDKRFDVKALHGDMTQGARDGVMISFKEGRLPLLVATDVAARGSPWPLKAPRGPHRGRPGPQAESGGRASRGARAVRFHPRDHRGQWVGRRGDPERPRARALCVRRGPRD